MTGPLDETTSLSPVTCPGCFHLREGEMTVVCPICKYRLDANRSGALLPVGTQLKRYVIGEKLGQGGFGITYRGFDLKLHMKVAIKEYYPGDLVGRSTDRNTVVLNSREHEELFGEGLRTFLKEARTLAQMKHPHLVRVLNYFEMNGTAYLVMDYLEGVDLAAYLKQQPDGRLPWRSAVELVLPVLDGLRKVHEAGFMHRDIKPDNLYRTDDGLILLDFGAARQAMGERSRSLSVMITEGYAPFEQYHRRGQGPWTDIYGLAATLYLLITGLTPPPATELKAADTLIPPQTLAPDIPPILNSFILTALSVDPQKRTQDLETFQKRLISVTEGFSASGNFAPITTGISTPTTTKYTKADQIKSRESSSNKQSNNSFIEWCLSNQLMAIMGAIVILVIGYQVIGFFRSTNTEPNKETVIVQTEATNAAENIRLNRPQNSTIPLENLKKNLPSMQNETKLRNELESQFTNYVEAERKRRIQEQERLMNLQRIEQERQIELLREEQEKLIELQSEEQRRRKKLERDQQADDQLKYWSCVNAMLKRGYSGADAQFQCRR